MIPESHRRRKPSSPISWVRSDTLLLVDPTEIRKEFAHKMEFVTRVRDASRSSKEGGDVLVNGYRGRMVAACRTGVRRTVPLALRLWSSRAPGFRGESDEALGILKEVFAATGGKGIVVYDRGGDRPAFYDYFLGERLDFIIRLKGRGVLSRGAMHEVHELARQCVMRIRTMSRSTRTAGNATCPSPSERCP